MVRDGASFPVIFALLDFQDPFEWDIDNLPHMHDDPYYGPEDVLDVLHDAPECYEDESGGTGDWLLVGQSSAGEVLVVPIAQSNYSGFSKVRPITVFAAPAFVRDRYLQDKENSHE